ncbi:MAG: hypothetical protein AAF439_07335 [Pseudomonadota bacterium]
MTFSGLLSGTNLSQKNESARGRLDQHSVVIARDPSVTAIGHADLAFGDLPSASLAADVIVVRAGPIVGSAKLLDTLEAVFLSRSHRAARGLDKVWQRGVAGAAGRLLLQPVILLQLTKPVIVIGTSAAYLLGRVAGSDAGAPLDRFRGRICPLGFELRAAGGDDQRQKQCRK